MSRYMAGEMAKKKKKDGWTPITLSLPKAQVADVERYAKRVRKGNKSGFVQDAIEAYIAAIDHVQANQSSVLRTAYSKTVKEHLIDKQSDDG